MAAMLISMILRLVSFLEFLEWPAILEGKNKVEIFYKRFEILKRLQNKKK